MLPHGDAPVQIQGERGAVLFCRAARIRRQQALAQPLEIHPPHWTQQRMYGHLFDQHHHIQVRWELGC